MHTEFPDFYTANIELLKKNHPAVYKMIVENPPEPSGTVEIAPDGFPNLKVTNSQGKEIVFHNPDNPEKERVDFLKRILPDHKGFVAILGMGLGYCALNILKERPHLQYLALFELDPGVFLQAVKHVDLSQILDDPRVILCIGENPNFSENLGEASRTLQLEDSQTLHHQKSFQYKPDEYQELNENIFKHLNNLNVGGTTTRKLGKDFLTNRFEHMKTIHHHQLLEQIKASFDGTPAVLVAGGPSLDKNIHLLHQIQDKAIIIAVDTVLPALLKNNVHPHFLTCIDPNNLTFEKFADILPRVKNVSLICASWVNQKTPKIFPAEQVFWTFTKKNIEAWFNSLLGGEVYTGGASTVAHLNLISAHMLGCDPIIFMGQDLAYPDTNLASHAQGTVLQGTAPKEKTAGNAMEETVLGINGKRLRSNRSFLSMKSFFESAISQSSKTHINATEGGAHIEGTQIKTLQDVIDEDCIQRINTTQTLKDTYSSLPPIKPENLLFQFRKMLSKTKSLQSTIKKADDTTETIRKRLKKLKKTGKRINSFNNLPPELKKKINKVDKFHKDLDNTKNIWTLVEEITMEGLKQSERQKQTIATLANDPARYIEWIERNLERLIDINKVRKQSLDFLEKNFTDTLFFHEKEQEYLQKIDKGFEKEKHTRNLAGLYIESNNLWPAKPLVEDLLAAGENSGEVYFYLGCITIQTKSITDAKKHFQKAKDLDPGLESRINSHLKSLGNEFLNFGQYFKTLPGREISTKYMVKKGIDFDPENAELFKELETILRKDIEIIQSYAKNETLSSCSDIISEWAAHASGNTNIYEKLPNDIAGQLFLYQGKLLINQSNINSALSSFKKAVNYLPEDEEVYSAIIETSFMTGDFNYGIEILNNAITLDKKFAAYWETIGDSLKDAGQNQDAIMAYEKCFMFLPENFELIKKIGDCYMDSNQLEAAKTAYELYKSKIETHSQ